MLKMLSQFGCYSTDLIIGCYCSDLWPFLQADHGNLC